ncbi:MAG: glycosyltransferase, partial [Terriglobales bacterium]
MADTSARPKLSILIPIYNERRTLRSLMRRVLSLAVDFDFEVVAVDDAST